MVRLSLEVVGELALKLQEDKKDKEDKDRDNGSKSGSMNRGDFMGLLYMLE